MCDIIQKLIGEFIEDHSKKMNVKTKYNEPLTAYADADDKMFYELKNN